MAARKAIHISLRAQASLGLRFRLGTTYSRLFEHSPPSNRSCLIVRCISQLNSSDTCARQPIHNQDSGK